MFSQKEIFEGFNSIIIFGFLKYQFPEHNLRTMHVAIHLLLILSSIFLINLVYICGPPKKRKKKKEQKKAVDHYIYQNM